MIGSPESDTEVIAGPDRSLKGFEPEYLEFMHSIATLLPLRLDCYKPKQMERRIRDLARKNQAPDLISYAKMLRGKIPLSSEIPIQP